MDNKGQESHIVFSDGQDDVLTLPEIAGYLKVSEKTILRMAQSGEIPSAKVSGQWRFLRSIVNDWLETKMQVSDRESLRRVVATAPTDVPLSRLVAPGRILMDMTPGPKVDVLRQLVEPLRAEGVVTDAGAYLDLLVQRENMVSTALGRGMAFPHVRHPDQVAVNAPAIVLGICRKGTDFDSLDGEPTFVFGLCCSASVPMHLRLLARLTLLLRTEGMVEQLKKSKNDREVARHIIGADWELSASI